MAMFHLLKIRTSIDIFKNEKCKITFGLEYIFTNKLCFNRRKKYAKIRNRSNQKPNTALKTKTGNTDISNSQNTKNDIWSTE